MASPQSRTVAVKRMLRRVPGLMNLRLKQLQWARRLADIRADLHFSAEKPAYPLTYVLYKHKSVLRRTLGQTDPQLQENKIVNLTIASSRIDGVLIRPGETFSLWRLVGNPTFRKGYITGLTISHGEAKAGVGGGLCQLANLIFWLGLHTPLEIAERHHHSYDLFPDHGRTIPFGSGTTIFYNYMDLRLYNPTKNTFQLRLWLDDTHLQGTIHSDELPSQVYRIEERNHRFEQNGDVWYRKNEIWRLTMDRDNGQLLSEAMLIRNCSEVRYQVSQTAAEAAPQGASQVDEGVC